MSFAEGVTFGDLDDIYPKPSETRVHHKPRKLSLTTESLTLDREWRGSAAVPATTDKAGTGLGDEVPQEPSSPSMDRRDPGAGPPSNKEEDVIWMLGRSGSADTSNESKELQELANLIQAQWSVEAMGEDLAPSPDEQYALSIMRSSRRRVGGQFEIGVLWRPGCPTLKSNLKYALARLKGLEKLKGFTSGVRADYEAIFDLWLEQGYIVELDGDRSKDDEAWYLPHFPVIKPGKVRPVFDGKADYKGQSLNSQVLPGPNMIGNLTKILLRFRKGRICLGADIKDMFLNVKMDSNSTRFHRFVWKSGARLRIFEFRVHIFGNTGSPSVAVYALKSAAEDKEREYPEAADTIAESSLMDDLMDSYQDMAEAKRALEGILRILEYAGFAAHKFVSNSEDLLSGVGPDLRAKTMEWDLPGVQLSNLPNVKVLGLIYLALEDEFRFQFKPRLFPTWTKRTILKIFPQIFDPLGLLGPFIMRARNIFQDATVACPVKEWDTEVPPGVLNRWTAWLESAVSGLAAIRVPRFTGGGGVGSKEWIHIFCDACDTGYCAVAYRVVAHPGSEYRAVLLMARVKVSPLKAMSMPRLELLAAELGVKVMAEVRKAHPLDMESFHFWVDAQDVLDWIGTRSRQLPRFIAHRVGKIQEQTCLPNWHKVPGESNPADVGSRGCLMEELEKHPLWWKGPDFLTQGPDAWTRGGEVSMLAAEPRRRVEPIAKDNRLHPARFSSFSRCVRVVARIRGWLTRYRARKVEGRGLESGHLTRHTKVWKVSYDGKTLSKNVIRWDPPLRNLAHPLGDEELRVAEGIVLRGVQAAMFPAELDHLRRGEPVLMKSPLSPLCPVIDSEGILRVGGRLKNSKKLALGLRSPVLLGNDEVAKRLMLDQHHLRHGVGYKSTLDGFFERFWCLGARKLASSVVFGCATCRKISARPTGAQMAPLPEFRIGDPNCRAVLFENTTLDVCGPFMVSCGRRRAQEKRWLLVLVCNVYVGVHIEVLHAMDTDSLLMAIKRFVARRGPVRHFNSDNGTNFRSADRELREAWAAVDLERIKEKFTRIEWDFGPGRAPNFQGLAESTVKAVKRALRGMITPGRLNDEMLLTFSVATERLLNERPLAYVSAHPNDIRPIRPADFMGMGSFQRLLPLNWEKFSVTKRYHLLQTYLNQWWGLFMKDLLPRLHSRRVWRREKAELTTGSVVALLDARSDRGAYPLGVVTAVHGSRTDGFPRSVEVQIGGKTISRPVTGLIPLVGREEDKRGGGHHIGADCSAHT